MPLDPTREPSFDLIYLETSDGRTMSCGVFFDGESHLIGPFPAKESGPQIVDALFSIESFGFADRKEAETAYMIAHFRNMSRGSNDAGQDYPYRVSNPA